jgi:DNA gyrase subunit A
MATKEEDVIEHVVLASTHDLPYCSLLTRGRVFRLKTYEVPAAGLMPRVLLQLILLQLHPEEVVTAVIKHDPKQKTGYFFMTTKQGT